MDDIKKLQELIDKSDNIVFFGGAGVSTLSGIKDFRSQDGLSLIIILKSFISFIAISLTV